MKKYITVKAKSNSRNNVGVCTGCVRDKHNIITCNCFIELMKSKGLESCSNGFIYKEQL